MTTNPQAASAITTQPADIVTAQPEPMRAADLTPAAAWSRRVRRIGGLIQAAFAAFWLARASLAIGGRTGDVLIAVSAVAVIGVFAYAIRVTAGTAPRPAGPQARRIERSVTIATIIELVAAFVLPVVVIAAGHSDWVLPSIVITIGPLLVATMSGSTLAVTTGFAAGVLLLGTAGAGFRDLAGIRPARPPDPGRLSEKA